MQRRIPFNDGWAFAREPGLPVEADISSDSSIVFEEAPASPDPSSGDTSVYAITPSVETPGPPTPPPSADPPRHIDDLIRAAAQRLQGAAPAAAADAAPPEAAAATPPTTTPSRPRRTMALTHLPRTTSATNLKKLAATWTTSWQTSSTSCPSPPASSSTSPRVEAGQSDLALDVEG